MRAGSVRLASADPRAGEAPLVSSDSAFLRQTGSSSVFNSIR
jgi:hypothetical protein